MIKVIQPLHYSPDLKQKHLYEHLKAVIEAVDIEVMLMNNPKRSNMNLPPDIILNLTEEFDNVIGLEETDFSHVKDLVARSEGKINIYLKWAHWIPGLAFGAKGMFSVLCFCPELVLEIYDACEKGDFRMARELFYRNYDLLAPSDVRPIVPTIKCCLEEVGFKMGGARRPYPYLPDPSEQSTLKQAVRRYLSSKCC